eukprot:GHVU01225329.1.p1 GENE.GHVU01225329.1~~GHVU01225329.1.p1  ORF type:complete len:213 (+),score=16.03 GHVU01225329.1:336-974(+)
MSIIILMVLCGRSSLLALVLLLTLSPYFLSHHCEARRDLADSVPAAVSAASACYDWPRQAKGKRRSRSAATSFIPLRRVVICAASDCAARSLRPTPSGSTGRSEVSKSVNCGQRGRCMRALLRAVRDSPADAAPFLPPKLRDITECFREVDDPGAKLELLIAYGKGLPEFDLEGKQTKNRVQGCQSTVWLCGCGVPGTDGALRLEFSGDSSE